MKLLRQTIRQLIKEGLKLDKLKNMALYRGRYNVIYTIYLLFDMSLLDDILDPKNIDNMKNLSYSQNIYGMIRVRTDYDEDRTECSGAWEVDRAAAKKGWGPTMYDIVMGDAPNGIMADRRSVSNEAEKIWDFYYNNRNDIKKNPLDWHDGNWTEPQEDDCDWGGAGQNYSNRPEWAETTSSAVYDTILDDPSVRQEDFIDDPLNWVYNRKRVINRPQAIRNFKLIQRLLKSEMPEWNNSNWNLLAHTFFNRKYSIDDDGV